MFVDRKYPPLTREQAIKVEGWFRRQWEETCGNDTKLSATLAAYASLTASGAKRGTRDVNCSF